MTTALAKIIGASEYVIEENNLSLEEMIYFSTKRFLTDLGHSLQDIDYLSIASSDGRDGRAISSMVTGASAGAVGHQMINLSSNGEHALIAAVLRIKSGLSDLALVVNWGKPSESTASSIERVSADPFYYRALGVTDAILSALQANSVIEYESLSRNSIEALESWCHSPEPQKGVSDGYALYPLRAHHMHRDNNGVVAILLTRADNIRTDDLLLSGMGWGSDSYWRAGKELRHAPSLRGAAQRAYALASLTRADRSLAAVEITDLTPFHIPLICRELGLTKLDANEFVRVLTSEGLPYAVNPSGGLRTRRLGSATGLSRVIAAIDYLAKSTGNAHTKTLAHAAAPALRSNSVFILERAA